MKERVWFGVKISSSELDYLSLPILLLFLYYCLAHLLLHLSTASALSIIGLLIVVWGMATCSISLTSNNCLCEQVREKS